MKRLLLLLIGAISIVTSAHAQLSPIDELAAEYEEVAQQLAVYAKLAERATEGGTRPEDVDRLEHQVIDIKQRLLVLAARLQAVKAENRPYIQLALGGHDGPRIAQAVEPGDSVAASIEIPAKGGSAVWQLHGPDGTPIVGARKEDKNIPAQGSYQARTQLKADHLTQGHYRFVFDYRPEGAEAVHAEAGFKVAGSLIKLKPFTVKARLNQYDGPPIDRPLRSGDILAASADVILAGQPDQPEIGNLVWRLLDSSGAPLPGKEKATQTFEKSGMEPARFRIRLDDLPDGDYRIELMHQLARDPAGAVKAGENFSYRQPVRIQRLVVSDSVDAAAHKPSLKSHQTAYMFAYYTLRPDIPSVSVELTARRVGGAIVAQSTHTLANKGGEQRTGMVSNTKLSPGEYELKAQLSEAGGTTTTARQLFAINDYSLAVDGPTKVRSGESAPFVIHPPGDFVAPISVSVDVGSGIVVSHANNALSGSVTGVAEGSGKVGRIRIVISDAQGKTAKGGLDFDIVPAPRISSNVSARGSSEPSTHEDRLKWCMESQLGGPNLDAKIICRKWDKKHSFEHDFLVCPYDDAWILAEFRKGLNITTSWGVYEGIAKWVNLILGYKNAEVAWIRSHWKQCHKGTKDYKHYH